jgi:glycosyl transferase family 2
VALRPGYTALIACHPARLRNGLAVEAFQSIAKQTLQPAAIYLVNDLEREGAGGTRQKLLKGVDTEWLAWCDSDDRWLPQHAEKLMAFAEETNSVYVFSWFYAPSDPLGHYGKTYDVCNPHHTTITAFVRTEIAQEVGIRASMKDSPFSEEDWGFIAGIAKLCCERGLKMTHLPERTWQWRMEGQNSSGLPGKGDAI